MSSHRFLPSLLLTGLGVLLVGCQAPQPLPAPTHSPSPLPTQALPGEKFRLIGYIGAWNIEQAVIQYDKLTHINYAFLLPNANGTFQTLESLENLRKLISQAHAAGVKVLISVGGWGYDEQFEHLAANPESRRLFVDGLLQLMDSTDLDGADIDWEYPDPGESSMNFLALMQELRQAMPAGKLLTCAVVGSGFHAEGIPAEVFPLLDFINLMVYDGSATDHSPYSYAEQALDYWVARGLPAEKTVLGVPFYARPVGIPYRLLVQENSQAPYLDQVNYQGKQVFYNGIPTLQRKVNLAIQRASGIMIWELSQDTADETSLLNAIHLAVRDAPRP